MLSDRCLSCPSCLSVTLVYCGQTFGRIKMPLGTEVGSAQATFSGWGRSSTPPPCKKGAPPIFGPCVLWPNGWMDQDATCYGGRIRPRRHCVRWGPSSAPKRGHSSPALFGRCLLWSNGRCCFSVLHRALSF